MKSNNVVSMPVTATAQQVVLIQSDTTTYGLKPSDIDARQLQQVDYDRYGIAPTTSCYKIPYYDINGKPAPHARVRILPDPNIPGDKGSFKSSGNVPYIYFPPSFQTVVNARKRDVIMIVDDERMAVFLHKQHGIPSVAVSGYSGWRRAEALAIGLHDIITFAKNKDLHLVIWIGGGTNKTVQTEVGQLAFELKYAGMKFSRVRQYTHMRFRMAHLDETLTPVSAFPRHPDIRGYISEKIANAGDQLTRKDSIEVALAMLADVEANGLRIKSQTDGTYYYFDRDKRELMKAVIGSRRELVTESDFLNYIYRQYGVSINDAKIMGWFATQFMAEEPIHETTSHKVMLAEPRNTNKIAIQISDSEFAFINARDDGQPSLAHIVLNGTNNILFERKGVSPIDHRKLQHHLTTQREHIEDDPELNGFVPMWWRDVIRTVRLDASERFKILLCLLYYTSPWLKGWRDIQLPIEVLTGEAGSGKSSLFTLRLEILTGSKHLPSMAADLRNWQTSAINTTGIFVSDNVHLMNQTYRQQLSDEICRIVTDLRPSIDTRILYTTADLARYPVNCTFGITSIKNVFTNIDFIQRAIMVQLDKTVNSNGGETIYGAWVANHLSHRGGREGWLAHHLIVLERFLKIASSEWNHKYSSKWRLLNLEQTLVLMAKVFGIDDAHEWLPDLLQTTTSETAVALDATLEGLLSFATEWKTQTEFTTREISEWAKHVVDYKDNNVLTNPRRLGRYMATNKSTILQTTKIKVSKSSTKGTTFTIVGKP